MSNSQNNKNGGFKNSQIGNFFSRKVPHKIQNSAEKNVREICLEVEMDDSVKDIISSPKKCSSTLLDVTVIKPRENNSKFIKETSTLNTSQVKNLIASMEMGNCDKNKLLDKIFCKKSNETILKIAKHSIQEMQPNIRSQKENTSHPNRHIPDNVNDVHLKYNYFLGKRNSEEAILPNQREGGDQTQQVYATPRTYQEVKNALKCKNQKEMECNKKCDYPCTCQNCAVIAVVDDTQKRPLFAGPIETSGFDDKKGKRRTNHREDICNLQYTHLTNRINELEERLAAQEERAVAKDYFKRIITKLVTHISKITSHTNTNETLIEKRKEQKADKTSISSKYNRRSQINDKYVVNPLLITNDVRSNNMYKGCGVQKEDTQSLTSDSSIRNESFWKWGEEILKPGIDLKNKILQLLEDVLKKDKKNCDSPEIKNKDKPVKDDKEIKIYVDVVSQNLYHENLSHVKNNVECINNPSEGEYYTNYPPSKHMYESNSKNNANNRDLNISYVNPKCWKDNSQSSISNRVDYDFCKQQFKKILENTKSDGKKRLWNTIWNQAITNGQSRHDRVTIQIPDPSETRADQVIEIYYTIAELQEILAQAESARSYSPRVYY